jgi:uncharacterized protein
VSERRKVYFPSADIHCAAWHYPGTNGACLVMAPGLAVPKEPGTDWLARRMHQEGFSVLAFDYRRMGESGGKQRQLARIGEQLDDFQAAIAYARALPEVDPRRIAIWGFSLSAGHVYNVAARNPDIAAAISQAGVADGLPALVNGLRHVSPCTAMKINALAAWDAIGTRLGRDPILVPLSGTRKEVAAIHTPDSRLGDTAYNPGGKYEDVWVGAVAASSAMRVAFYRPGLAARRINVPLLVLEYQQDGVSPPGPAAKAARRAPRGELVKFDGGHYTALLNGTDEAVGAMVDFLSRHVLEETAPADVATEPLTAV